VSQEDEYNPSKASFRTSCVTNQVFNNSQVINKRAKLGGGRGKDREFHLNFSKCATLLVRLFLHIKATDIYLRGATKHCGSSINKYTFR